MRKIETEMLLAITDCRDWKLANTQVKRHSGDGLDYLTVLLHGNEIARIFSDRYCVTLAGWSTRVTINRLGCITYMLSGDHVYQRDHVVYLHGEAFPHDTALLWKDHANAEIFNGLAHATSLPLEYIL